MQSPRGSTSTVRVFLLDDHELLRRGLREVLDEAGGFDVIGESGLAEEAMRRIPALRPDARTSCSSTSSFLTGPASTCVAMFAPWTPASPHSW